jgi:hypothetical protein
MTARKPATTAPAVQEKPFDPTRCALPARNMATFWKESELSPRRARELEVYEMVLMPKIRALSIAQKITGPNGEVLAEDKTLGGIPTGLSLEESRQMFEMADTAAWVYLKSWTLKGPDGGPLPLPETVDDLLDLPPGIYLPLIKHGQGILRYSMARNDGFSVDSVEDPDSPTGV